MAEGTHECQRKRHEPSVTEPGRHARRKGSTGRPVEAVGPDRNRRAAQGVPALLLAAIEGVIVCV